jgi:alkanesulfonate monooxygenase SsuD/methylene tetrahydromethanopterin reductase-like flavin-dependent oxidoreductase (luciferase family)
MIGLSFAAAATSTIGQATGVLLLPEHNPVIVAKQAASLDKLSGGRFTLGIGIGWSREEFAALGIPSSAVRPERLTTWRLCEQSGVTTSLLMQGNSRNFRLSG